MTTRSLMMSTKAFLPAGKQAQVLGTGTQPCLLDSAIQSLQCVTLFWKLVYAFKQDQDES